MDRQSTLEADVGRRHQLIGDVVRPAVELHRKRSGLTAKRVPSYWKKLQVIAMPRSHRTEVALVQRCNFLFTEVLANGDDRCVDHAEIEIRISRFQFRHAGQVVGGQMFQTIRSLAMSSTKMDQTSGWNRFRIQ